MARRPLIAIVGAANAPSQDSADLTPVGLMAQAAACALEETSLTKADIDGLFTASSYYYLPTMTIGEYLQIRPTYSDSTTVGGCSFIAHLRHAARAIAAGDMSVGLIAHASTQRTDGSRFVKSMSESLSYEVPYGPLWPITGYAMMAHRHMHQFGTTPEQLAEVAVAAREWALLNPEARQSKPLTIEDVLSSPMVSSPLHRYDCCLVTNGGGALIVASPERAPDLCEKPVYVWGAAESHDSRYVSGLPDFVTSPARVTGPAALDEAGVTLDDIDVLQIYDSFTIANIITLEDLGFCDKGEGGPFVEGGTIRPGGKLAVNTSGGGLSYRHPGMLGMVLLLEAMAQLRGEAAGRQVAGAASALVHGLGAIHMSGATAVLGGPGWRPGA